ncbi:hypothetical protein [Peribacillus deserti]|uniref:Uncharacterized protein n=1 Tax=Peribacillus deserti TaxID=673318 RepID=A0A2N5M5Q1_9BACI|nr:hypothetical protein [Peribacillus deserti]PLT29691.1 hypothetical protein CUU66_11665 [Peribacillus deserti]
MRNRFSGAVEKISAAFLLFGYTRIDPAWAGANIWFLARYRTLHGLAGGHRSAAVYRELPLGISIFLK